MEKIVIYNAGNAYILLGTAIQMAADDGDDELAEYLFNASDRIFQIASGGQMRVKIHFTVGEALAEFGKAVEMATDAGNLELGKHLLFNLLPLLKSIASAHVDKASIIGSHSTHS